MAAKAFVLIETQVGKTKEVYDALEKLGVLKTVDVVTGPYDIIAVIEEKDMNSIGTVVTTKVHPVAGITRTVTCLSIKVG